MPPNAWPVFGTFSSLAVERQYAGTYGAKLMRYYRAFDTVQCLTQRKSEW